MRKWSKGFKHNPTAICEVLTTLKLYRKRLLFYLFIVYLFFVSGAVAKLCKLLNIKVKNSRPYYPLSQGKVKRSNETWKRKLEFDISQGNSLNNTF